MQWAGVSRRAPRRITSPHPPRRPPPRRQRAAPNGSTTTTAAAGGATTTTTQAGGSTTTSTAPSTSSTVAAGPARGPMGPTQMQGIGPARLSRPLLRVGTLVWHSDASRHLRADHRSRSLCPRSGLLPARPRNHPDGTVRTIGDDAIHPWSTDVGGAGPRDLYLGGQGHRFVGRRRHTHTHRGPGPCTGIVNRNAVGPWPAEFVGYSAVPGGSCIPETGQPSIEFVEEVVVAVLRTPATPRTSGASCSSHWGMGVSPKNGRVLPKNGSNRVAVTGTDFGRRRRR